MLPDWKTLPSLTSLRAFEATARHGSFASAARALNVTHAAVAQQVRSLETALGVSLAIRSGRRVSLTDAGTQLAAALSEAFGTIAAAVEDMRGYGSSRPLRIVARPFLVDRLIMPNLAQFWQMHPGVEISIQPRRDFSGLQQGSFDLAIPSLGIGTALNLPGTESREIARVPMVAIAAPSLVAREGSDLTRLPWLWHDEDMDLKLSLMAESGLPVERLRQARIGSPSLQVEALKQGIGVGLFNARMARFDIEAGDVIELPLPRDVEVAYCVVYPKGPHHPLMESFVTWLETLI